MNISDFKTILEGLIHSKLYKTSLITKEQKRNLKEMKKYMRNTKNFVEDLRTIVREYLPFLNFIHSIKCNIVIIFVF